MGRISRSGLVGLWMLAAVGISPPAAADPNAVDVLAEPLTSMVEVRQSGGFDPFTLSLIDDAVRAVRGESTELHRVTLRMLRVTRGDNVIQEAPRGFGYPMLTLAIDPGAPVMPVELRTTLARGYAAMGEITARLRGAEVGDLIDLEMLDRSVVSVRIGAIVPDAELRWSEILVGVSAVPGFEIDRPYSIVAWGTNGAPLAAAIRIWTTDPGVRVFDGTGDPATDPVLPMAMVKERFGEFAIARAAGDTVQIAREWRDAWIVDADFPIVGETRCHRLVVPYIRAALEEVERSGLAARLDRADFQLAGGCYNPRFNRGADPGYSLSRHSWGIAVDFNPSTNPYGSEPVLPQALVDIFRRWGFSWGGGWAVPDGMHFEWFDIPSIEPTVCSDATADLNAMGIAGMFDDPLTAALPSVGGTCQ